MVIFAIGVIAVLLFITIMPYLGGAVSSPNFLNLEYFFNKITEIGTAIAAFLTNGGLRTILSLLAIFFITIIIYTRVRLHEIYANERKELEHDIHTDPEPTKRKNARWEKVLELGFSENPTDWRFAIIEADTMLDEMTVALEYPGETLGERLKAVDRADWKTLQEAWEAHLVRNKIAHEGSDFNLDRDEARRILGLYERVFKEFDYI